MKRRNLGKRRLIDLLSILVLVALPVIVLKDIALHHKFPFYLDPLTQFFPFRSFAADMINSGNFPLWNPYSFSGIPFLANIQTAVFYPPNIILYFLFSNTTASSISIIMHFIFAGLFTYLFLRKLKVSRFSCLMGGIAFMFSGFLFPKIALPPVFQAAALIPFVFYCFELALEKRKIQYVLLAGLSLCVFIFNGYPHLIHTTLIVLGLYSLLRLKFIGIERREKAGAGKSAFIKRLDIVIKLSILYTFIIFITGGFKLSFFKFELSSHDIRKPLYLVLLLVTMRIILSVKKIYIEKKWKLFFKRQIVFVIIVIIGVLLSAVQFLPSLEFTKFSHQAEIVHLKENVRGLRPSFGIDLLIGNREDVEGRGFIGTLPFVFVLLALLVKLKRTHHFYLFLGLSLFLILVCFRFGPLIGILWHIPGFKLFPVLPRNLAIFTFTLAVLAAVSFDLLAVALRRLNVRVLKNTIFQFTAKAVILSVVIIQLINTNSYIKKFIAPEEIYKPAESIEFLRSDEELYRIFEAGLCGEFYRDYPRVNVFHFLVPNMGLLYKISDIQGYDPLQLKAYKDYVRAANLYFDFYPEYHYSMALPLNSNFLNLLNVKYFLSNKYIKYMNLENYKLVLDTDVKIYENKDVLPRAFIVRQWALAKTQEEFFYWMQKRFINPRDTVVLQNSFADSVPVESYLLGEKEVKSDTTISVHSAGLVSGNYAKIILNGKRVEKDGRGYNIAVIDPETGRLEQSDSFDTSASTMQSELMAKYLKAIQPGKIVAVAVRDDASSALTQNAVEALKTIGAAKNIRSIQLQRDINKMLREMKTFVKRHGEYFNANIIRDQSHVIRWSHAIIGMKGLEPGKAIEIARPGTSAVHFPQTVPAVHAFKDSDPSNEEREEARISFYSPNKIVIDADLSRKGFLVLSEIYYPGWKAYVDGKEREIIKANSIFRALYLKKGSHRIEFRYSPLSFKRGLAISLAVCVIVVAVLLLILINGIVNKVKYSHKV